MLEWLKRLIRAILGWILVDTDQPQKQPSVLPEVEKVHPEYRKSSSLMTFQEKKFFRAVLLEQFAGKYTIFSKVRLGDLVGLANEPTDKKFHSNQIQCKHIDFVLCSKGALEPLLAIELDDSSHSKFDRRESDELKDRVCAEAKLPLLRVKVQQNYESELIAQQALSLIQDQSNT